MPANIQIGHSCEHWQPTDGSNVGETSPAAIACDEVILDMLIRRFKPPKPLTIVTFRSHFNHAAHRRDFSCSARGFSLCDPPRARWARWIVSGKLADRYL